MAAVIARRTAAELGWQSFQVRSAGIAAFDGDQASGGAVRAAAQSGLDLSAHGATLLTSELAEWADFILVMSPSHLSRVGELGGAENAALITSFAEPRGDGEAGSVPDPIGGSDEDYRETFEFLEQLIARAVPGLEPGVEI